MDRNIMRQGNNATTEIGYINRVSLFSSRLEYIGSSKDFFYLSCKDCGSAFRHSKVDFKPSHRGLIRCPKCEQVLLDKKSREKRDNSKKYEAQLERWRLAREEKARARIKTYTCKRCGNTFQSAQKRAYCSKLCNRRQNDANKEHKRRIKSISLPHDVITLRTLAERAREVCWICNERIDWNDYSINENGIFIAGNNYPSIDHVFPLKRGGTHTWDNVRLAHRLCNSRKSASIAAEEASGQFRLIL